jgi:hypothetical protein
MLADLRAGSELLGGVDESIGRLARRYGEVDVSVNAIVTLGDGIAAEMRALERQSVVLGEDTAATRASLARFRVR